MQVQSIAHMLDIMAYEIVEYRDETLPIIQNYCLIHLIVWIFPK